MKLLNYSVGDEALVGVLTKHGIVELTSVIDHRPRAIIDLLRLGQDGFEQARQIAQSAVQHTPLDRVRVRAPILKPAKFLGIGGNFRSHIAEVAHLGFTEPTTPIWFNKQTGCVNGPYDDIIRPHDSDQLDYEGELALVIARDCRHVSVEDALDFVAGYMVCNDVSVRDWQRLSPTSTAGKSFDSHGPIGPYLVTPDEVGDPQALRIRTWVNGDLRQDGTTTEMIFSCAELIADISRKCSLEAGDIISIGSPAGVGGVMTPPMFLRAGDRVRVEVQRVGMIENRVVEEDVSSRRTLARTTGAMA